MESPPYIASSTWFPCTLTGKPNNRLGNLTLKPARSVPLEGFTQITPSDPHRNEKCQENILRLHCANVASFNQIEQSGILTKWEPDNLSFDENGLCTFKAMVEGSGGPYEICAQDEEDVEVFSKIFAVRKIMLVSMTSVDDWESQLQLPKDDSLNNNFESQNGTEEVENWPKYWFKDLGRKTLRLSVTTSSPLDHRLKLKALLAYSDGSLVKNQNLLSIRDSTMDLSSKKSVCNISLRILDTSRNHQNKAFVVIIQPANDEDVGPLCSFPVIVCSKTLKRSRRPIESSNRKLARNADGSINSLVVANLFGSISQALTANSSERLGVEERLNALNQKVRELLIRSAELSVERMELENKFRSVIEQYSVSSGVEMMSHDTTGMLSTMEILRINPVELFAAIEAKTLPQEEEYKEPIESEEEVKEEEVVFVQKKPIEFIGKPRRWPAFNKDRKVIGYFNKEGRFFGIAHLKESWVHDCEIQVVKNFPNFRQIYRGSYHEEFVQQINSIIKGE